MNAALSDQIGTAASVLTVLSFLPQVIKIWRQRDAQAISLRMYALLTTATALWTWFGVTIGSAPVIATNSICLILQASILGLKINSITHTARQPPQTRAGSSETRRSISHSSL